MTWATALAFTWTHQPSRSRSTSNACFRTACSGAAFPSVVAIDGYSHHPQSPSDLFGSLAYHARLARLEISPRTRNAAGSPMLCLWATSPSPGPSSS
ncbi:hypothetical protein BD311DRAFT_747364 [Dichomitus squalens]|uniref:Uncharacterized protein n=1 Tax=Dichomitus squalens TaxID=114155 RepID=A0A4V2K1V3_9APHY|nr:hypothetical protein BD311DRAFT_747364 [Dichomitus squalens]